MTSLHLALGVLILSAIPLTLLCLGDPKRRRASRRDGPAATKLRRRLLVAASCLPGVIAIGLGDTAAFMIWLGAIALVGWGLATAFAVSPSGSDDPGRRPGLADRQA